MWDTRRIPAAHPRDSPPHERLELRVPLERAEHRIRLEPAAHLRRVRRHRAPERRERLLSLAPERVERRAVVGEEQVLRLELPRLRVGALRLRVEALLRVADAEV